MHNHIFANFTFKTIFRILFAYHFGILIVLEWSLGHHFIWCELLHTIWHSNVRSVARLLPESGSGSEIESAHGRTHNTRSDFVIRKSESSCCNHQFTPKYKCVCLFVLEYLRKSTSKPNNIGELLVSNFTACGRWWWLKPEISRGTIYFLGGNFWHTRKFGNSVNTRRFSTPYPIYSCICFFNVTCKNHWG